MYDRYRIKKGDNLDVIAKKFNTEVETLKTINNLYFTDSLREGLEIIVPVPKEEYYNYYTVSKGDTLYKIGQKYNINPELLASLNGLDMKDYIYPNQEILIPKYNYSYYITKDGDTLEMLTNIFKTTKNEIIKNNETIYLLPGQIIVNKKD